MKYKPLPPGTCRLSSLVELLRALGNEDAEATFKLEGPTSAGSADPRETAPDTVEHTDQYQASASVGRSAVFVTIRRPYITPKNGSSLAAKPKAPSVEESVDHLYLEAFMRCWKRVVELEGNLKRLRDALDGSGVNYRSL